LIPPYLSVIGVVGSYTSSSLSPAKKVVEFILFVCDKLPVSSFFAAGKDIYPIVLHQLVNLTNLLMSCVALGKQTEA
jgi:hypothetical protein